MKKSAEPEISVIIPAYRAAATVCQAVDSALAQNVSLEVIVVDDCSPDELQEVLKVYEGDERVQVIRNRENRGVARSRNRGVQEARGEYIAFLDSDDWWAPGKLVHQLQVMRRTGAVLCCTGRELMKQSGESAGRTISVGEKITYRSLLMGNVINCSSVLLKREAALEFPMEYDAAHEDYITWLRILRKYGTAVGIGEPYLKYRLSEGSKSGSKLHSAKMTYRVYRYIGYGTAASALFFCSYAVRGVWKYFGWNK